MAAMAAKSDFEFCNVCRRNHGLGRRHIYSKKHCAITKQILIKYGKKINETRKVISAPSVVNGELEPGSKFWCHFCAIEVAKHITDGDVSVQFGGVFEHLASVEHLRHTNKWWAVNGADKNEKNKFLLTQQELQRFKERVKDKLEDLATEVGKVFDKSVVIIQEKEKRQKIVAAQPPEPCVPPAIVYRTVRNRHGVMQNPTGFHDGQRVWGGGVVKHKNARPDQWYPWEFDFEDGGKTSGGYQLFSKFPGETNDLGESEDMKSGNIHTGATPPWLLADDEHDTNSVMIGPSLEEFQKHVERSKKSGRNPNRVGANFDRKTEVNSDWLPSFGGVWNAGPRWQTRRNFNPRHEDKK
ncbi:coiled-coil domain-containing protein 84-like isoform X2 [Dendronephthya gigantea]|uniref:coiled-coil domain-containing protein 84-like isoform X2 n=1 Tax=Dendronephthya gigantea TaxID=151771 RepID=UPI00106A3268|nr:coiled-coil domain-containing protein 84-like isoform X2 [Dendronephthya gigantea]